MTLPSIYFPERWKTYRKEISDFWKRLTLTQRITAIFLFLLVLTFPFLLWASSQKTRLNSRALTPTPTVTPVTPTTPSNPPITATPTPRSTGIYITAAFQTNPVSGTEPLTVSFTNQTYGIFPPFFYTWNFGDGTTGNVENPSHTFVLPNPKPPQKTFTVTLTATDINNNTDSTSNNITVYAVTSTITPTLTPTRTPTPTPYSPNRPPVITTSFLPFGRLNTNYLAFVKGVDPNTNDDLSMSITNLPRGLKQGVCSVWLANNQKNIQCVINGKPLNRGMYSPFVILRDNRGGIAQKRLMLFVF